MSSIKTHVYGIPFLVIFGFSNAVALADSGRIEIKNPPDGAKLNFNEEHYVDYDVVLGKKSNHIHV